MVILHSTRHLSVLPGVRCHGVKPSLLVLLYWYSVHCITILEFIAEYVARVGVPFIVPVHPGPPPAAAITVALHNYNDVITDVTLYKNLSAAITSQILSVINASFLSALKDPDFGFGDVPPLAIMLTHL